jgi:hypothetical protein
MFFLQSPVQIFYAIITWCLMKYMDTPIFFNCIFSCVLQVIVQPDVLPLLYVLSTVFDLSSACIVYVPKINFNVILLFPSSALEMAVFHNVLPPKVCTSFSPLSYILHAQHNHHLHNLSRLD